MPLPTEKVAELKQLIHTHLSKSKVQNKIQEILSSSLNDLPPSIDDETIGKMIQDSLKQHGIIDDVMNELCEKWHNEKEKNSLSTKLQSVLQVKMPNPSLSDSKQRHLYLQILRGKAFLDYLSDQEPLPGQTGSFFRIFIKFFDQRFRSQLTPCACEPEFDAKFLLELQLSSGEDFENCTAADLLSIASPIHLIVVRIDEFGSTSLVSSHFLEWRSVLTSFDSRMHLAIELFGVGAASQVPIGVLEVQLELIPSLLETLTPEIVTTQLNLERNRRTEQERLFLVYAKQWWQEYLQIRPSHEHRYVKIFAQDENGCTHPVCQYVTPLQTGRLLETPFEAAWFVALIQHERISTIGGASGAKMERWAHLHTVLCLNKGDCEEHAVLLCSLLLGFGLDAYVAIGTKTNNEPYSWVVVLGYEGFVTFWDPLTSIRYNHAPIRPNDPPIIPQPKPNYPFVKIGSLFNHRNLFANNQSSDSVFTCQFDITDESLWKGMSPDSLSAISGSSSWVTVRPPSLICNSLDPHLTSTDLESELQALIMEYRRDLGLMTIWDPYLSYLLSPALAGYELEKKTGLNFKNDEFNLSIRRFVPNGHTFKGYPVRFNHIHARRMFAMFIRSSVCEAIVRCRGDLVRHAIRCRVFVYPENVVSSWIMIAVKYKCVV